MRRENAMTPEERVAFIEEQLAFRRRTPNPRPNSRESTEDSKPGRQSEPIPELDSNDSSPATGNTVPEPATKTQEALLEDRIPLGTGTKGDPRHKQAICVVCGHIQSRRSHFPHPDTNDIPWYECEHGCDPPEGLEVDATCVPLHPREFRTSVFDPRALPVGAYLAPSPEVADSENATEERDRARQEPLVPIQQNNPWYTGE